MLVHQTYETQLSSVTGHGIQNLDEDEPTEWLHRDDSFVPHSRPDVSSRKRDRCVSVEENIEEQLLRHIGDYRKVRPVIQNTNLTPISTNTAKSVVIDPSPGLNIYTGMH